MIIFRIILVLILFWCLLIALAWLSKWFIIHKIRNLKDKYQNTNAAHNQYNQSNSNDPNHPNEPLVPCARCGIYVTKSQAIKKSEHYYCSQNHVP